MNLKRAIRIGVLTYITLLIIGGIAISFLGINPMQRDKISNSVFAVHIITTIIIAAVSTLFYLKDKKIKSNAKEGLLFGIVLIIIGFILDMLFVLIYSFISSSKIDLLEYYIDPIFWSGLILLLATTAIIGSIKGKK